MTEALEALRLGSDRITDQEKHCFIGFLHGSIVNGKHRHTFSLLIYGVLYDAM